MNDILYQLRARFTDCARRYWILRKLARGCLGTIRRRLIVPPSEHRSYEHFRLKRLQERKSVYKIRQEKGLLSLVTTVWNTRVSYLEMLVNSVRDQVGGTHFEWVILDNGSDVGETVQYLRNLEAYSFIKLHRVEENIGIIGGMRFVVERAIGQYIIPVDSDDYLYPDAVTILNWHIKANKYPALLYSDEDKLLDGQTFTHAYFKPKWDPVLFINSCYIAHLCAINRDKALELGAYTDKTAEGSHDWDTFVRFINAGYTPVHIPELIYSWRMHPESTAANITSKGFIHTSQVAVLKRFLAAQPRADLYNIEASPLFDGTPDWWIRRLHIRPRPMVTLLMKESRSEMLGDSHINVHDYGMLRTVIIPLPFALSEVRAISEEEAERGGLVHLLWDKVRPEGVEWPWEVLTQMELFPDTVMVGGRILDRRDRILAAGSYLGYGTGCDCPDRFKHKNDPGYFAQMWKQRTVSAVSSQHAVFDAAFLVEFLDEHRQSPVSVPYLGEWAGAYARRTNRRVVYTPFLSGVAEEDWASKVSDEEKSAFLRRNWDIIPETYYLSPHLSLESKLPYSPSSKRERVAHLEMLRSKLWH
ncbi:MAG: glycosyltransferase [Candidatus Binatia bacterium]